jgi:hypothetical protein
LSGHARKKGIFFRQSACSKRAFIRKEPLIVIVFVIRAARRRRTLESTATVILGRILRRGRSREKYIVAGPAQLRSAGSEARGNAISVRYIGPAQPKHIRRAGLTLLVRPLSSRRCFRSEQKYKRCDTAGYLISPHPAYPRAIDSVVKVFNCQNVEFRADLSPLCDLIPLDLIEFGEEGAHEQGERPATIRPD